MQTRRFGGFCYSGVLVFGLAGLEPCAAAYSARRLRLPRGGGARQPDVLCAFAGLRARLAAVPFSRILCSDSLSTVRQDGRLEAVTRPITRAR